MGCVMCRFSRGTIFIDRSFAMGFERNQLNKMGRISFSKGDMCCLFPDGLRLRGYTVLTTFVAVEWAGSVFDHCLPSINWRDSPVAHQLALGGLSALGWYVRRRARGGERRMDRPPLHFVTGDQKVD